MDYRRTLKIFLALTGLIAVIAAAGCGRQRPDTETESIAGTVHDPDRRDFLLTSGAAELSVNAGDSGMTFSLRGSTVIDGNVSPDADMTGSDGENRVMFRFVSSSSEDSGGGKILKLKYSDSSGKIGYTCTVTVSEAPGAIEISGQYENLSGDAIRIYPEKMISFTLSADGETTAWKFSKDSGQAEGYEKFPGNGITKILMSDGASLTVSGSTDSDWNKSGDIPIVYLDVNGRYGAFAALETPCGRINVTGKENGAVYTDADLGEGFSTVMPAGETLDIPPVYVGIYDGDTDDGSNVFKRWFFSVKVPESLRNDPAEPYTQTNQQMMDILYLTRGIGVECISWDNGWWKDPDYQGSLAGDWVLRSGTKKAVIAKHGCNTLADFGSYCRKKGMNFTLYLLLHSSDNDSGLSIAQHPEWFTGRKFGKGYAADLGNAECVAWLKENLTDFFISNNISGWRTDFEPIASSSANKNRHDANGTDVQFRCAEGYYELLDFLAEKVPGFRLENCSQGGSLKDYATMSRSTVVTTEDSGRVDSIRMAFYDSSYCLPPAQLQLLGSFESYIPGCPNYTEGRDPDYGARSFLLGAPAYVSVYGQDGNGRLQYGLGDYFEKYFSMYREKIRPLVRNADLYHILPRPDGVHWDGVMYIGEKESADRPLGAVFLFKPTSEEGNTKTVFLRGLDPDTVYRLEFEDRKEQNSVLSGKELSSGIDVTINGEQGSEIIWIYGD